MNAGDVVTLIVAGIAAVGGIIAAAIGRTSRGENAADHERVRSSVVSLNATVSAYHDSNKHEHEMIHRDLRDLRDDFTNHLEK